MPLPADLTESALAEWLFDNANPFHSGPLSSHTKIIRDDYGKFARAVRELVEAKVREGALLAFNRIGSPPSDAEHTTACLDAIVTRILGAP